MRQRIIVLSLVLLGIFFVITVTLTRTYEVRKGALVRDWSQEGDSDLAKGKPSAALEDYRNALAYDPGNPLIQLHLAQSLLAAGRLQEAHTYFLNLWDGMPGSGILNLELARTSAQMNEIDQAVLYYRTAILGGWDQRPELQRRNVRLELCNYLIMHERAPAAQAEIAALADDAPPDDVQVHEQVADLYLKTGLPARALAELEATLKTKPDDAALNELAGQLAYQAADYAKAERYLARALRRQPSDAAREMLMTVRQIQDSDPLLPALTDRDRAERTQADYRQAVARLGDCEASVGGQSTNASPELAMLSKEVSALAPPVNPRTLEKNPEFQHHILSLVFQIEDVTARYCDAPAGMDEALVLIGKKHAQSEQ